MAEFEGGDSTVDDISALRAEFKDVVGHFPSPRWGADKLREKIDAARLNAPPPPPPEPDTPPSEPAPAVEVMLVCDHVFLPKDPAAAGWERSSDTVRFEGKDDAGRRVRLEVHPTLAAFLQKRNQAEIL